MPTHSAPAPRSRVLTRPTRRLGAAFTLLELLVVLSVVALLVGLLLPALAGARDAARTLRCGANMRQLGVAGAAYAADHGGRIRGWVTTTGPRRAPGQPRDARWWVGLGDHLGGPTGRRGALVTTHVLVPSRELCVLTASLNCPSIDPDDGHHLVDDTGVRVGGTTTAVNRLFDFRKSPDPDPDGAHPRGRMIRLDHVRDAGSLLHFSDGWGNLFPSTNRRRWVGVRPWSGKTVTAYRPGLHGGAHADPGRRHRVFWPHPGAATGAVFLDGHAETLTGGLPRATLDPWNG